MQRYWTKALMGSVSLFLLLAFTGRAPAWAQAPAMAPDSFCQFIFFVWYELDKKFEAIYREGKAY